MVDDCLGGGALTAGAFAVALGCVESASSMERTCVKCGSESDRGRIGRVELFPLPAGAAALVEWPLVAVAVSAGGWVATRVSPLTFAAGVDHAGTAAVVEALEVPLETCSAVDDRLPPGFAEDAAVPGESCVAADAVDALAVVTTVGAAGECEWW